MNTKYLYPVLGAVLFVLAAIALVAPAPQAEAGQTYNAPVLTNSFVNHSFFNSTTTSATSTNAAATGDRVLRLDGADKVTFYFSRAWAAGGNAGTSRFEIEVSPDGVNWYDFNRLYLGDVSKTATSSVSISAATSTTYASMDIEHSAYRFARCQVVETMDGAHTCTASVQY